MDIIQTKTENLFPFHIQLFGWVCLFIGLVALVYQPLLALVALILGAIIVTGTRAVEFDSSRNLFREFNSFLFIKSGKWKAFEAVEKIYINASRMSQEVYTKVTTTTTFRSVEYTAYLKFSDGRKIYLLSSKNKKSLMKELAPVARYFELEIMDNTI